MRCSHGFGKENVDMTRKNYSKSAFLFGIDNCMRSRVWMILFFGFSNGPTNSLSVMDWIIDECYQINDQR
jgi:hypothetical protein